MKIPENSGRFRTNDNKQKLKDFIKKNTPTRFIALKLGKSENSIYSKAYEEGVSLQPTNQSRFNRKKK